MAVTLDLENGCIVSDSSDPLGSIDFGTMDFGSAPTLFANDLEAQAMIAGGAVELECSSGADLFIQVGDGMNASGGVRRLADAGEYVEYRLFTQPSGGGDEYEVNGTPIDVSASVPLGGGSFELPIYGLIAPQAGLVAGTYTDTVTITLTF